MKSSLVKVEAKLQIKDDDKENPSFHQSVGPALAYGQFFGILPVDGVLAKDETQLAFRWRSIKTVYSMIFLFCGTVESCLGTRRLLRLGFNIQFAEGLLFFIAAMVRSYMFFHLASHWRDIIAYWRKCEDVFLRPPYVIRGWSLRRKIQVAFVVLTVLAHGEANFWKTNSSTVTSHFSLSRAHLFSGNSNQRQQLAVALLHTQVGSFLGELPRPLPATSALSLSLLSPRASALWSE